MFHRYEVCAHLMATLLTLPDIVLVQILSHIPITDLLLTVNRTCRRINNLIENTSSVWKDISTEFCVELTKSDLTRILKHAGGFECFLVPFANIKCYPYEIDFLFSTNLVNSKNLYWLDISRCKLSTLCFLQYMPSLTVLNVSECPNLVDEDFEVISLCTGLDHLYMSYNSISFRTITSVCSVLDLMVLDLSGIRLTTDLVETVIKPCMFSLQISLIEGQEEDLNIVRSNHLDCSIRIV